MRHITPGRFICLIALLFTVLFSHAPAIAEPTGTQILDRAALITGGKDGRAHITFTFKAPGQKEQRLGYAMLWTNHPKEAEFASKVIYFTEFPTNDRGKAYLGHIRHHGAKKPNKEWLYLPELLAVRKLSGHHHDHSKPDEFAPSVLTHADLMERPPTMDDNRLLGTATLDGKPLWQVESRPKKANDTYPYRAVIRWIDPKTSLTHRTDYIGQDGTPVKKAITTWQKIDGEWLWHTVVADNLKTGAQTIIEMKDAKVNTGLKDKVFNPRILRKGPNRFF